MPVKTFPIQPQYDDALTEADMLRAQGIEVPDSEQPINQTYEQFIPSAQDMQGTALQEQYAQAQAQAMLEQQAAADQYQQYMNKLKNQETQTDLSPLMALADAWGTDKSNFAASYKRPMSADERNAQLMGLQEKLAAQRGKIADSRTQALGSALKAYSANKVDPQISRLRESQIASNLANAGMKRDQATPAGQFQKMGAEAKQKIGHLTSALGNLTNYESEFASGERPSYITPETPGIGTLVSSAPLDVSRTNLEEAIGRLASGGAINKDEEARFRKMIPTPADNDQISREKIKQLRWEFENKLTGYGMPVNQLGSVGFDTKQLGYGKSQQEVTPDMVKRFEELKKKAGK